MINNSFLITKTQNIELVFYKVYVYHDWIPIKSKFSNKITYPKVSWG